MVKVRQFSYRCSNSFFAFVAILIGFSIYSLANVSIGLLSKTSSKTVSCAPLPPNAISWWRGEANTNDELGNFNGSPQNGVTFAPGMVGQAFNFSGSLNELVRVDNFPLTNQFTVEGWIRLNSLNSDYYIVATNDTHSPYYDVYGNGDEGPFLTTCYAADGLPAGACFLYDSSGLFVSDITTYHHFAISHDGAMQKMYLDGIYYPDNSSPRPRMNLGERPANIWIGGFAGSQGAGLSIDELTVYSRGLSAAEIQAIYAAGSAGKCTASASPTSTTTPVSTATLTPSATSTATNTITGTPTPINTPPGTLDVTFGSGGKVFTPVGNGNASGQAVAVQADGKIVLAGSVAPQPGVAFAVVRYNADGSLDASFGTSGTVITDFGGDSRCYSVVIQADGKIILGGSGSNQGIAGFGLVRYNTNGSLDTSFGNGGKVVTAINGVGQHQILSLAIETSGKIVAAGFTNQFNPPSKFALARYNMNGSLDTTFGVNGIVTTLIGSQSNIPNAVAIQLDGKIVAGGYSNNGMDDDFTVARYLSNGQLDAQFGNGGTVVTLIGTWDDYATSVNIQADGKIILSGTSVNAGSSDFAAVRYNADGSLDQAFGTAGVLAMPIGLGNDYSNEAVIQSNGKIIFAGSVDGSLNSDFGLLRLSPNSSLDTTFGNGGKVITPVGNFGDYCYSTALQADGKIIAAGYSSNGQNNLFSLVRYIGDSVVASPTPTPSAMISGSVTYGNAIGAATPRFVSNVTITGAGSPNVTTITSAPGVEAGQYTLTGFGSGSYTVTPTKTGGVNGITSFDAARIAQHVAGINVLTGNQLIVADVSGNGTLSSFDAGQVARYVAGITGFGSTASWIFNPVNRMYASITTNISGEDYSALLMGEVSGNWVNAAARP